MFGTRELTVERGREIQQTQVDHYAANALELGGEAAKQRFLNAVAALNATVTNPQSGWDIPRGGQVEALYFKAIGKTDAEYAAFLRSLD